MAGRRSKYETNVKSRFNEIKEWLQLGATEKEIAKKLDIHKSTFIDYKDKYPELVNLIKESRRQPVEEIKAAMLKRAKGFQYEEKKVVTVEFKLPSEAEDILNQYGYHFLDSNKPKLIKTEVYNKYALPDVAAGLVLLQHWDKNEDGTSKWSRDPANLEVKKAELELKKEQAENNNW